MLNFRIFTMEFSNNSQSSLHLTHSDDFAPSLTHKSKYKTEKSWSSDDEGLFPVKCDTLSTVWAIGMHTEAYGGQARECSSWVPINHAYTKYYAAIMSRKVWRMVNDVWQLSTSLLLFSIPFITTVVGSPHMIFKTFFPLPRTDCECVTAFEHINYLLMLTLEEDAFFVLTHAARVSAVFTSPGCCYGNRQNLTVPVSRVRFKEILESNMRRGNAGTEWSQVLVNIDQFQLLESHRGTFSAIQVMECCSALSLSRALIYRYCDVHVLLTPL